MPHWGIAHAAGPNPNSRYQGLPDDPQGAGLAAIRRAMELADNGSQLERDLIAATYVLYNKDAVPDDRERDFAFWPLCASSTINTLVMPISLRFLVRRI